MFFSKYFSFPCQYHSTITPYPFIHLPPTLYNVFLPILQFPLSVSFHHHSLLIFICILLLPEGQKFEAWEPSKKLCSFENRATSVGKELSLNLFRLEMIKLSAAFGKGRTGLADSSVRRADPRGPGRQSRSASLPIQTINSWRSLPLHRKAVTSFCHTAFPNPDHKTATAIQVLLWHQTHVQNWMHEGIKNRLNSRNVCYNSVQKLFLFVCYLSI